MTETSGADGWTGAATSAPSSSRVRDDEPDVAIDRSVASRSAFVMLSGVLLSQATGVVAGVVSLVGAFVTTDADVLFVVQLIGGAVAFVLGVAVLAAAVRYAGASRRRADDGDGSGVIGLVVVVLVVLACEPATYALHIGATMVSARRMGIESFAHHTERSSYVAIAMAALRIVANLAILGWAWLRARDRGGR